MAARRLLHAQEGLVRQQCLMASSTPPGDQNKEEDDDREDVEEEVLEVQKQAILDAQEKVRETMDKREGIKVKWTEAYLVSETCRYVSVRI